MEQITVDKVAHDPGTVLAGLVEESSAQGFGALRRLLAEWTAGTSRFGEPGEGLFIALEGGRVVGVCALDAAPGGTDKSVGRLRDMYVSATLRRHGVGKSLVRGVVAEASKYFATLVLRADTPAAAVFYESRGFRPTPEARDWSHRLVLRPSAAADPGA
jgi:GNAT superfamily N-acetyltransferase